MNQKITRRDAEATKERILTIGIKEFCENGYSGSRIQNIAENSNCNIRMIYHYFENKEGLYKAALERVYGTIRGSEAELGLTELDPVTAIRSLIEFTFDHHLQNRELVDLVVVENVQRGRYLNRIESISQESSELIDKIERVLVAGEEQGLFRKTDAFQLYVSILSLSFFHLSNAHTLSIMYDRNLSEPEWISERRIHVVQLILAGLKAHEPVVITK
ncbi:MAG: TetR family transcriptional regulator [Paracoccaceae bacterium]|nr:TetR family transcriptional regulator [Paracoccaceae bacterium]